MFFFFFCFLNDQFWQNFHWREKVFSDYTLLYEFDEIIPLFRVPDNYLVRSDCDETARLKFKFPASSRSSITKPAGVYVCCARCATTTTSTREIRLVLLADLSVRLRARTASRYLPHRNGVRSPYEQINTGNTGGGREEGRG